MELASSRADVDRALATRSMSVVSWRRRLNLANISRSISEMEELFSKPHYVSAISFTTSVHAALRQNSLANSFSTSQNRFVDYQICSV